MGVMDCRHMHPVNGMPGKCFCGAHGDTGTNCPETGTCVLGGYEPKDGLDLDAIWVYDCEVFAHDWLFVFKRQGAYEWFWNDPEGLAGFAEDHEGELFAGFNSSHYDQYILKAILAGCDAEQVKEVNDWIVGTENLPWEQPYLQGFFADFHDVDLMKDTQMGTSLKSIEGHAGMDIEESTVPFDWPEPLTPGQMDEVLRYCMHDVDATEELLRMRKDYLATKAKLGERAGLPLHRALALTNAKLTAAVLEAEPEEHDDERAWTVPGNMLVSYIPPEAMAFFGRMADGSVPDDELWSSKLELEVGECPVTLGFGGIHGALPKWRGESGNGRVLVNADVSSYYPSLMVRNGYTSRNMPEPGVFEAIYEERLAAKKAGDKATANSLKLVVNTTYGATLNRYNDLYDPLMARSVCVSGQLYLLELARHLVAKSPDVTIVQLNTDGILVEVPEGWRETPIGTVFGEWQERTGFELEFDEVERIWQKDVNNYAMRLADGHEKVKGGYLVRGASTVGAFSINNNATVVADALKAWLLDGTPVRETVAACRDPAKFQLIAKAGRKYSRVYQEVLHDPATGEVEQVPMQKCNRVFAGRDGRLGRLYKVKAADGSVAKVENLPDCCLVSNGGMAPMEDIDVEWYIALAEKRARDFESEDEMTETTNETAAKPAAKRTAAKKAAAPDYSTMNLFQKLALARRMFLDAGVQKSGVNDHAMYDYFELADIVPAQTRIFAEVGLVELFRYEPPAWQPVSTGEHWEPRMTEALATATVVNADNPAEQIEFRLKWSEVPPIVNKQGKEVNTAIQRTGGEQTYMRRYLKMQVLDIVEADAIDKQDFEESADNAAKAEVAAKEAPVKKAVPVKNVPVKKASRPKTAKERQEIAAGEAGADGEASALQVRQLKKAMKKLRDEHGAGHPEVGQFIAELSAKTGKLTHGEAGEDAPFTKAECERAIVALGEMREQFENGGE